MMVGVARRRKRVGDGDTAGLGNDQMHAVEEKLASKQLARFKEDTEELLEVMNEENAVRVFSLLEDSAQLNRDWMAKLKGSPGAPNRRRSSGIGDYLEPYGMNDETFGAQALHQITAIVSSLGKEAQINGLVKAIKTAKDGGMTDIEERLQKKLDSLLEGKEEEPAPLPALSESQTAEESTEPSVVTTLPSGEEVVLQ